MCHIYIKLRKCLFKINAGFELTVAQLPLATENDDGWLKTHSKVVRVATNFYFNLI